MEMTHTRRAATVMLAALPLASFFVSPASAEPQQSTPMRVTTNQQMISLQGRALAYYLYQRYMAQRALAANQSWPQMYWNNSGYMYIRNAQGRNIPLTVPQTPIAIPRTTLQQFAPNYTSYTGYNGRVHIAPNPSPQPYTQWILSVPGAKRGW